MAACEFADDAYLLTAFPAAAVLTPEVWMVTVVTATVGEYAVVILGASFPYVAAADDDATDVQQGLAAAMAGQMLAAVSSVGANSLMVSAQNGTPLDLEVSGPGEGDITATLVSGGDSNAAARAFWLERAKCGLPPCCAVTCAEDYTLMHAALAAHYLMYYGTTGAAGGSAQDFQRMRLGPAELSKGASAWAAGSPADGDLAKTAPGQLYLSIRAKYVMSAMVSCGNMGATLGWPYGPPW